MSKLSFISVSPGVNLTLFSNNATVVVSTADVNNSVPDDMINLNWFSFVSQTAGSQLSISVVSPNKDFAIFAQGH